MTHIAAALLLLLLVLAGCLAPSAPTTRTESGQASCPPRFETIAQSVLESVGVSATSTFFPAGEAEEQQIRYPGKVCPARALAMAVHALLTSLEPESLIEVSETIGLKDCPAHCYFNRPSSLFGLVADPGSKLTSQSLPLPPAASGVSEHWIFFLSVPDLGEHGYWALISRDGSSIETLAQN